MQITLIGETRKRCTWGSPKARYAIATKVSEVVQNRER